MTTMRGQVLAMLLDSALRTWGTREDLWLQFSQALIARGVRPVLVFSEAPVEELRNRFRANGVEVEAINYGKGVLHYYRELGKVVRNYSVTAVHIAFFNYFHPIPWLARLRGVRYIVYQERNPWGLRSTSWKKWLVQLRARAVTLPMTRVIAISEFLRQQMIDLGIPEQKIFLVHHGVDTRRFSPNPSARDEWAERFGIGPDEMIVTSIGFLKPVKHSEVVVEACGLLARRGVKVRAFMAGDGEMRQELAELSRKLGVGEKIQWLGHCANPERLLQASDIFVLASVGEAFGLVVAEAMACGVPVVGSRSAAIPEIVEDGKTGLLAAPLDPASFADAIERLARDERLRRDMGRRSLERVQRSFTAEASIDNLLKVYESMWSG